MLGASQLGVYNKALRNLGERKLANLQEKRDPRFYLDDEWTEGVQQCLSAGYWNFAMRTLRIDASPEIQPAFGFKNVFPKPEDWVRTFIVADNEDFNLPLKDYVDENFAIYTGITPIYLRYVSDDPNFGWNLTRWTPGFVEYVAAYLAFIIAPRTGKAKDDVDKLDKRQQKWLIKAASRDAMDLPPGRPPHGTWVTSRAPRGSVYPFACDGGGGGGGGSAPAPSGTGQFGDQFGDQFNN